ncbi:hypothetical protein FBR01_05130 [Anaerolineae bacterium CFX8]|nr:hypothetical protein [Anaerolineae bacterium CFX8]
MSSSQGKSSQLHPAVGAKSAGWCWKGGAPAFVTGVSVHSGGVGVGVSVAVGESVGVGVSVGVSVGVKVAVSVGVGVSVGVNDGVRVGVGL